MPKTKTKPNKTTPTSMRPIRWAGTERPPAKRWWWYVGFGYIALITALLAVGLDDWFLLGLVLVGTVAVYVVYLGRPRVVEAVLTSTTLSVNGQTFRLSDFRAYRRADDQDADLVLIPRRTLRIRVTVPLPDSESTRDRVLKHLGAHLDDEGTDRTWLDRVARWIRLG